MLVPFQQTSTVRHYYTIIACICLSLFACQPPPSLVEDAQVVVNVDAQTPDAQTPDTQIIVNMDAQIPDAQIPDAQIPDAQIPDAQIPDAQILDAQILDAQIPDAHVYPNIDLAILPDMDIPDMMVMDMGPTECQDDFNDPRPVWNQFIPNNPNLTTPYPDYHNISNNLNILKSLKLLASIFTKASQKLEGLKDLDGTAQSLLDPDEAQGHCICNGCAGFAPTNAQDIWNHVQTQVTQLAQQLPPILQQIIENKIEELQEQIEAELVALQNSPDQVVLSISSYINSQLQIVIDNYNMNCANGNPISLAAFDPQIQASLGEIQTAWDNAFAAFQALITQIKNTNLSALWNQATTLLQMFAGIDEIEDLVSLDWNSVVQQIQSIISTLTPLITQIQTSANQIVQSYNTISMTAQQIATAVQSTLQSTISALPNIQSCQVSNLLDPLAFISGGIQTVIQTAFQQSITSLTDMVNALQNILNGDLSSSSLAQLDLDLTPLTDLISNQLVGCHMKGSSAECIDYCDPAGVFFWGPVDFFKDPTKSAGSMALMTLRQLGWLDQIAATFTDASGNQSSPFLDAINAAIGALGDIATFLENLTEIIDKLLKHVDTFTEGYHLGAYDTLRPDLHVCVGYAGHGAFAQLGGLGNNKVSIGGRYTSHNLSRKQRVQFRSGGFAISFFDHALSLAPTLEVNTQMNGWRIWDAQRPFGIPLGAAGTFSIPLSDIERYDIFHLVDQNELGGISNTPGQISLGDFLVKDLYTGTYSDGGMNYTWPRPDANGFGWENSVAVVSLGLNLELKTKEKSWELPAIPIFPPYVTAIPYFTLQAGIFWKHEANYLRDIIREKINEGLSAADQLSETVFERNMHAMQAPDLTGDNGTAAFVKPGVGVIVFAGFNISKVRVGIGVDLSLKINIQPSAFGGIVDFNSALQDIMMSTNVPQEAPCEPVLEESTTKQCSNAYYKDEEGNRLSAKDYACQPTLSNKGACCITVTDYKFCAQAWTGINKDSCGALNQIRDVSKDVLDAEIDKFLPDRLAAWITNAIISANQFVETYNITANWSDQGCDECPGCTWSTAELEVSDLSECQQNGYCTYADGTIEYDISADLCTKLSTTREVVGSWTPYQCVDKMEVNVTRWEGAGCSPLQSGFASSCGCLDTADCAEGETCDPKSGRCMADGQPVDCTCGGSDGGSCTGGRTCVNGACMKVCSQNDQCPTPYECLDQVCKHPYGVPTAEEVVNGLQNTTPPLHTISTYALTMIEFLVTFGAQLYIELSFKLFGKSLTWRILDLKKFWDLASARKTWYQPGLEARYQSACADALGEGVTNRFPQGPTNPVNLSAFNNANIDIARECFLTGAVCRYPEDPSVWATLPPVYQDPRLFSVGNAGTLDEFVAWCKADMPNHKEDPAENSDQQIAQSLVDTLHFGEDVGMDLWAANQLCIAGVHWTDFMSSLPTSLEQYQCEYTNPVTHQSYQFSCLNTTEEMLGIWGCLKNNATPWASLLALQFPSTVYQHPVYGPVFDLDQIFAVTPTAYTEGILNELQLEYGAIYPTIRNYSQFGFNISYEWLNAVSSCFNSRQAQLTETLCECTQNSDCSGYGANTFCDLGVGACKQTMLESNQTIYLSCPIVELQVSSGLCCGDGIVQSSENYSEQCDDGNLNPNDGCDSQCKREGDQLGGCHETTNGICRDNCPDGLVCNPSCSQCVTAEVKTCQRNDQRMCLSECPAGEICDDSCSRCVPQEPVLCSRDRAGVCMNQCPDGLVCDADCNTCVPRTTLACQFDGNVCMDQCPSGFSCNADCQFCQMDQQSPYACKPNTNTNLCEGNCPSGFVCDSDCVSCVVDPTGGGNNGGGNNGGGTNNTCGLDSNGVCMDQCPANQSCSQSCNQCCQDLRPCDLYCLDEVIRESRLALANQQSIDVAEIFVSCQRNSGCPMDSACVSYAIKDSMREWMTCESTRDTTDEECLSIAQKALFENICKRGCLGAGSATACQLGQNRMCADACPRGFACDAQCQTCLPTFEQGCNLNREGVCENRCPTGQICDRLCNGCVEPIVRSCTIDRSTNACIDRCADGFSCDSTCSGCVRLPPVSPCSVSRENGACIDSCPVDQVCDADCGACVPKKPAKCQIDTNSNMCISNCGEGYGCDRTCTFCEARVSPICDPNNNCYDRCLSDKITELISLDRTQDFGSIRAIDPFALGQVADLEACLQRSACTAPTDPYCSTSIEAANGGAGGGFLGKTVYYMVYCLAGNTLTPTQCVENNFGATIKSMICDFCY